ncbi:MAG: PLP-dependent aminotransferase family protein [Ignavibacteriae bacterium]|nr:MAG: PLP-dependent aminotransferase family protein [Ignavibacteriota bacterium]
MILLNLKPDSAVPLFRQIVTQIKELIENDVVKPGSKLPSTRSLSEKLGVNRSTIYKAYEELWALGYIESRPGSYSVVRKRVELAEVNGNNTGSIIHWCKKSSPGAQKIFDMFAKSRSVNPESMRLKDIINLSPLLMDNRLFPAGEFRKSMNRVLKDNSDEVLDYGEHQGYKPLREYIANRLRSHSISTTAEEILITNGSQHAIDLIFRMMTVPGDTVILEEPTYALAIPLLKLFGIKPAGIPMLDTGMDLNYLDKYLKKNRAAFLYTIPNFQNPTGTTTSQMHREQLLGICEKYKLPLVEDGFEEEMKYFGKVVLPIKSMDKNKCVIYLGSFSKVLFPGARIGWIAAGKECIDRILAIKRFTDLSSNAISQAALYDFCLNGHYDIHIKRMHRLFSKRMRTALKALKKYMPENKVIWSEPAGGYLIWLKLNNIKIDSAEINKIFLKHGVIVSPGKFYYLKQNNDIYFRISISTLNEKEIETGMKRLGEAITKL